MVAVTIRSPLTVPAWHPSVAAIIGIALGGAAFLGVLVALSIVVRVRSRHRRAIAVLEQQALSRRVNALEGDYAHIVKSQMDLRQSLKSSQISHAGWGALSSKEDLPQDKKGQPTHPALAQKKTDSRAADLFSWPFSPKRRSQRGFPMKRLKPSHLSAILESPRSPGPRTMNGVNESEEMILRQPSIKEEVSQSSLRPSEPDEAATSSGSPKGSVVPSAAFKPEPLFSGRNLTAVNDDTRSYSVPSVFLPVPSNALLGRTTRSFQHRRGSRSISMGTGQEIHGPNAPLPPLPDGVEQEKRNSKYTIEQSPSRESVSSQDSAHSSILEPAGSPSMKAAADFSKRHPELGLGAQIRENQTDLKTSLIGSRRAVESRANPLVQLNSTHGSFLVSSTQDVGREAVENRYYRQASNPAMISNTISPGSNSNLTLAGSSNTPRRNSSIRQVSANGSPLERQRNSGTSVLRDVSGNRSATSKETSQNQEAAVMEGSKAVQENPFQWKNSPAMVKKSSLKPALVKHGNISQSSDVHTFTDLSRTAANTASNHRAGQTTGDLQSQDLYSRPLPRPPSSSKFDPQLNSRPPSFQSSFAQSSSAFSVTQYYREMSDSTINNQKFLFSDDDHDLKRQSTASSANSFSMFPHHAGSTSRPIFSFAGPKVMRDDDAITFPYRTSTIELNPSPSSTSPELEDGLSYFDVPSPSNRLSPTLGSSSAPSGLTPSPKARATTMLSAAATEARTTQSGRVKSSPANPLNTRPELKPPNIKEPRTNSAPEELDTSPAQDVVKTIKALRRMDSVALDSPEEKQQRQQYLRCGRDTSPDRSHVNLFKEAAMRQAEEEKENDSSVFEKSKPKEPVSCPRSSSKQQDMLGTPKPDSSAKKVAWGSVEIRERSASATPNKSSLYDGDGFLMV